MMKEGLRCLSLGSGLILLCIGWLQCSNKPDSPPVKSSQINTAHLDALYDEVVIGGDTIGYIHIYAEYPDYHLVGDEDEGIACVDDASRAAIFYLKQYERTADPEHLRKGSMLIRFLLAMQAPNGYYYNFIWPDGRIHTDGQTTMPEPNFWSWRTLWAFGEAIQILGEDDPLVVRMRVQREKLVNNILTEQAFTTQATDTTMGWTFPTWLPKVCGTDQAAIILTGLSLMVQQEKSDDIRNKEQITTIMHHFAEGIMMMQVKDPGSKQDGAFLSWENIWHAYANVQAYSLMLAGQALKDSAMINSALYEVLTFYPALLAQGRLNHFSVRVKSGKTTMYDVAEYAQIAYGVRPMVWASLEAFEITGDHQYLEQAKKLAAWFAGDNPAKTVMYDPATGRGFDGISSPDQINRNSGAESTIEALLTLQALEKYDTNR